MKNVFWLLIPMATALALFSSVPKGQTCSDCGPVISLPFQASLWSGAVSMKLPYPSPPAPEDWRKLSPPDRLAHVRGRVQTPLETELKKQGLRLGNAAFIRVFKESRSLELWLQSKQEWRLFRSYPIAAMSGSLGPKLIEGDGQAPEGFYSVTKASLNPASKFHLSFNIGYPNAYDQHHGRTGSFIMVHGNEVSIGCFAMTDPVIEEIYLVVEAALSAGQESLPVHVFPFPLTPERLAQAASHSSVAFWEELRPGYEAFQPTQPLPRITVQVGRYVLQK